MRLNRYLIMLIIFLSNHGLQGVDLTSEMRGRSRDERNKVLEEDVRNKYVQFRGHEIAGLFCVMLGVVGLADRYETGVCTGFQVDFDKYGLYYDPTVGPNWWSYYFEPIKAGVLKNNLHINNDYTFGYFFNHAELDLSRHRCKELIDTYINLLPKVQSLIDAFYNQHFKGYVIGIHYRGTDKYTESPRTDYKVMKKQVKKLCTSLKLKQPKIFVATDEEAFLDYMYECYPDQIIAYDSMRAQGFNPVHYDIKIKDKYRLGEDAVVDSYLLSKCDCLIKTSSNLSLFSTMLNPGMPVIEVSKNY